MQRAAVLAQGYADPGYYEAAWGVGKKVKRKRTPAHTKTDGLIVRHPEHDGIYVAAGRHDVFYLKSRKTNRMHEYTALASAVRAKSAEAHLWLGRSASRARKGERAKAAETSALAASRETASSKGRQRSRPADRFDPSFDPRVELRGRRTGSSKSKAASKPEPAEPPPAEEEEESEHHHEEEEGGESLLCSRELDPYDLEAVLEEARTAPRPPAKRPCTVATRLAARNERGVYRWTEAEDRLLEMAVELQQLRLPTVRLSHSEMDWHGVAERVGSRTHVQCRRRWPYLDPLTRHAFRERTKLESQRRRERRTRMMVEEDEAEDEPLASLEPAVIDEFMDDLETEMLQSHETIDQDLLDEAPQAEQEIRVRIVHDVQSKMVKTQRGLVFELATPSMGIFRAAGERVSLAFGRPSASRSGRTRTGLQKAEMTDTTPDATDSNTTINQYFKIVHHRSPAMLKAAHSETDEAVA
tara:strand:+ start:4685 stop:6094 length:1410 start_codon:yes stop_codon:yes gene_type:complete